MPPDYKCHSTTCRFAALNVLEGKVIGSCYPRHRNIEFRKFLRQIDGAVLAELSTHMMLDNSGTHNHPRSTRGWYSVPERGAAIDEFILDSDENPQPFVWTKTVDAILEKRTRYKALTGTLP